MNSGPSKNFQKYGPAKTIVVTQSSKASPRLTATKKQFRGANR
jgi:hypothetical protein